MATIRIPGGPRGVLLAKLMTQHNPESQWRQSGAGIEIEGPRLQLDRWMVEEAYWPGSPPGAVALDRFMRHFVRADPKTVRLASPERIIVEEEPESEQPLLVRFPATLKARLATVAEALSMSQNELVVRAVEDLVSFAEEITRRPPIGQ